MSGGGFNLGDYKEVSDRIPEFYERYPDGRIAAIGKPEVVAVKDKTFIGVTVGVWRTPDDPQPCIASAWEPFPGATSYTKDSEMMNAETSAWGRALVAAGILAKGEKVASRNEVRNRRAETQGTGTAPPPQTAPASSSAPSPAPVKTADQILAEARAKVGAKPAYADEDMVCGQCGRKEFIKPYNGSFFCSKRDGGCGAPRKGEAWEVVSYGEFRARA